MLDKLSIILPVYNERKSIEPVIKEWNTALKKYKINFECIVCEDGSTDGTSEFLRKIKNKYNLVLNQSKTRRGYGGAVIDGILTANNNFILSIDSDGQCNADDFMNFWKNRNKADVIIGWRKKRADTMQRKIYSFMFGIVFKLLFINNIHDPSAPFVLYKKKTITRYLKYLKFLKEGFWWGFVGMCVKKNLSLYEVPIDHRIRLNGDTVVYKTTKIPSIAISNIFGLFKLKLSK